LQQVTDIFQLHIQNTPQGFQVAIMVRVTSKYKKSHSIGILPVKRLLSYSPFSNRPS